MNAEVVVPGNAQRESSVSKVFTMGFCFGFPIRVELALKSIQEFYFLPLRFLLFALSGVSVGL